MKPLNDLQSLESLYIDSDYNNSNDNIKSLKYLKHIKSLYFGYSFNYNIDFISEGDLPSLRFIKFNNKFNKSIEPLKNCVALREISFNYDSEFNINIDFINEGDFPVLESLKFGKYFNQTIEKLKHCMSLKHLYLCGNFEQNIDSISEYKSLESIVVPSHICTKKISSHIKIN